MKLILLKFHFIPFPGGQPPIEFGSGPLVFYCLWIKYLDSPISCALFYFILKIRPKRLTGLVCIPSEAVTMETAVVNYSVQHKWLFQTIFCFFNAVILIGIQMTITSAVFTPQLYDTTSSDFLALASTIITRVRI